MKKSFIAIAVAAIFAACNSTPKANEATVNNRLAATDTAGLAQFQMWKSQQEVLNANGFYNGVNEEDNLEKARDVRYINEEAPVAQRAPVRTGSSQSRRVSSSSNGSVASSGQTTTQPARKKGWSKAAKGTVIGAGSGAVLGAIVSKKKGKGAIIGGILGAGAGYVIGRSKDKKDGRY